MSDTLSPLTDAEYLALRAYLLEELSDPDLTYGAAASAWMLWTGAHPVVITEPSHHNLQIDGDYVTWRRPKTRRYVRVPLVPELRPTAAHILASFWQRPLSLTWTNKTVKEVGRLAGIPGVCSPRTLRHTYIARVMRASGNPYLTAQLAATTYEVAQEYARYIDQGSIDRMLREGI